MNENDYTPQVAPHALPYGKKIAVVGCGTVGIGVAQCLVMNGIPTILKAQDKAQAEATLEQLTTLFQSYVERNVYTPDEVRIMLGLLRCTQDYADISDVDIVVEAASLNARNAADFYRNLDGAVQNEAIFATNTSSLSISELAAATQRPDRFIGMHFFTPVPTMKLVEVVSGQRTRPEVVEVVLDLARRMGKAPIEVDEAPGFVVNRLLMPMINEAIAEYAEGVASIEDIDAAMRTGANHPMGPMELADFIGLDNCLAVMEGLYAEFNDPKYRPHPVLRKKVRAGELGRKTGVGFYRYE